MEHAADLSQQAFENDEIIIYFRLYILLYADDTVLFAESKEELQAALYGLFLYCKTWKLSVNSSKTNIVVFSKRKVNRDDTFTFVDERLEIEDDLYI